MSLLPPPLWANWQCLTRCTTMWRAHCGLPVKPRRVKRAMKTECIIRALLGPLHTTSAAVPWENYRNPQHRTEQYALFWGGISPMEIILDTLTQNMAWVLYGKADDRNNDPYIQLFCLRSGWQRQGCLCAPPLPCLPARRGQGEVRKMPPPRM